MPEPTEPRPEPALGYAIAEQRPCERCGGSGCDELTVADYEAAGIDIDLDDDDLGTPEYADDCLACNGDGTRWVVTDVKVEPVQHYCERGDDEDAYSDDVRCDPDRADYWLRVRS